MVSEEKRLVLGEGIDGIQEKISNAQEDLLERLRQGEFNNIDDFEQAMSQMIEHSRELSKQKQ